MPASCAPGGGRGGAACFGHPPTQTPLKLAFVFYVLASMELIAEEIENPFGTDANDLPTDRISTNIRKHVEEIL